MLCPSFEILRTTTSEQPAAWEASLHSVGRIESCRAGVGSPLKGRSPNNHCTETARSPGSSPYLILPARRASTFNQSVEIAATHVGCVQSGVFALSDRESRMSRQSYHRPLKSCSMSLDPMGHTGKGCPQKATGGSGGLCLPWDMV